MNVGDVAGAGGADPPAGDLRNLVAELAMLPLAQRELELRSMPVGVKRELVMRFVAFAHDGQVAPPGEWRVWLMRAGRGFGKTLAGAEWVSDYVRTHPQARVALVSGTKEDVRRVMVEGPSGLLKVARDGEVKTWTVSSGELKFTNGAIAYAYSAGAPESLRGPEHHVAWCDELGKWRAGAGDDAWTNLTMTMRGSTTPRILVTTTPRPTALMRRIRALPDVRETEGRTRDNPHLPRSFLAAMIGEYGDTRIGRQELDGEMLDDAEGALWTRALIERCRVAKTPPLVRVVVGVDPPAGTHGDACGIVACGEAADGTAYVLEDASVAGLAPEGWAAAVAGCFERNAGSQVIAEKNQGGSMVESVLLAADAGLPVTLVHASTAKVARAEPIATFYARGRVRHAGRFPALEDEMCGMTANRGYDGPGRSPDRADALVWALSALLRPKALARVRGL